MMLDVMQNRKRMQCIKVAYVFKENPLTYGMEMGSIIGSLGGCRLKLNNPHQNCVAATENLLELTSVLLNGLCGYNVTHIWYADLTY